jgi:hypothetical protein
LTETKYLRKNLIADVLLGIFAVLFLFVGGAHFNGYIQGDKYPYTFGMGAIDILDPSRIYDVGIAMNSTSFSAQTPIDVAVTIKLERGTPPNAISVIFPSSYRYPLVKSNDVDVYDGGIAIATKQSDGIYRGSGKIMYPLGGCYAVFLGSKTVNVLDIPDDKPVPCKVQISGLEATTQIKSNNINTGLTYLIIALTILSLRPIWQDIVNRFF